MKTKMYGEEPGVGAPKEKDAGATASNSANLTTLNSTGAAIELSTSASGPRAHSRVLAAHLGIKHQSLFELIKKYRQDFEVFGLLRFQTGVIDGRGQPEKFVLLNEDQSLLALTYSRNTERVRHLKVKLVKAFGEARRAAGWRQAEYIPEYHRLHDAVRDKAGGSPNQKFVHINVNKALNSFAGLEAGQRGNAPAQSQSLLNVAQMVAAKAMQSGLDHRDGFERVKQALGALKGVLALGESM